MKTNKVIFWSATGIIFLFEGIMSLFYFNSLEAKAGIMHLGYPEYFRVSFLIFKILGALTLIIPQLPARLKEWAYAGFAFDFIFAVISHIVVDGIGFHAFFPIIFIVILVLSYQNYHKIYDTKSSIS